ncbi:MAG: hypothetical protein NTV49_02645 [Kiritimatiellaeota bacterium]|nr:hypothetical protein [Kiritimatiellota bacterium]
MYKHAMVVVLVGLVGCALVQSAMAADPTAGTRVTITGMGHALSHASGNMNPMSANATVTVTENGSAVVYYVCGWAGVIVAKQGDGKKVEVTGVIGEKYGKKTITGKSIDVKIIVV